MDQLSFTWAKKKISLTLSHAIIIGVLLLGGGVFVGAQWPTATLAAPIFDSRAPEAVDLAPLFEAWKLLDANFVPHGTSTKPLTTDEKLWGMIQGLAGAYGDDYTVFLPPVQKELFESSVRGDFSGVGMEIGIKSGQLIVVAPIKDTPAMRAGIQPNDRIVKIDGENTSSMTVDIAVSKIRGEKGTAVTLTISRDGKDSGKPFDVSVVRDTIVLPTIDTKHRSDDVFVISLYSFDAQSPRKMSDALQQFERSGTSKLVVDLRGNPGGYLEAAVDIASWFLPEGKVVVSEHYGPKRADDIFKSGGYGYHSQKAEVVVLINGGSASASEIFAGALRDNGRAKLVGTQSFGKGSVQQLFDVTDDTTLKITIARWLTPNGTSLSHGGLTPDIIVDITEEDIKEGRDPQLERAVQYLLKGQ